MVLKVLILLLLTKFVLVKQGLELDSDVLRGLEGLLELEVDELSLERVHLHVLSRRICAGLRCGVLCRRCDMIWTWLDVHGTLVGVLG